MNRLAPLPEERQAPDLQAVLAYVYRQLSSEITGNLKDAQEWLEVAKRKRGCACESAPLLCDPCEEHESGMDKLGEVLAKLERYRRQG